MNLVERYLTRFGKLPARPYGYTYEDEKVKEKIEEALKRNKPLTLEDYKGWKQEGLYIEKEEK